MMVCRCGFSDIGCSNHLLHYCRCRSEMAAHPEQETSFNDEFVSREGEEYTLLTKDMATSDSPPDARTIVNGQ